MRPMPGLLCDTQSEHCPTGPGVLCTGSLSLMLLPSIAKQKLARHHLLIERLPLVDHGKRQEELSHLHHSSFVECQLGHDPIVNSAPRHPIHVSLFLPAGDFLLLEDALQLAPIDRQGKGDSVLMERQAKTQCGYSSSARLVFIEHTCRPMFD